MAKHTKDDFDRVAKKLGDLDIPEHVEDLPDELPLEEPEEKEEKKEDVKEEKKETKEEKKEPKEEKKEAKKEVKRDVKKIEPKEVFGFMQQNSFVHGFKFGLGFWLASIIMIIVLMFALQLLQNVWWRIF